MGVTKDCITVAKEIEITNSFQDIGCSLLYHIENNCEETASDGPTTPTVMVRYLHKECIQSIGSGVSPMDIKIRIDIC